MSQARSILNRIVAVAGCLALAGMLAPGLKVLAQSATADFQTGKPGLLRVDASAPQQPAGPADYSGGSSKAPNGATIGVTDRYLTLNGKPWLPVMGELHYSRLPEAEWEDAILRMKSSGVNILSTYVIWIHHEEIEGKWDWSGQRNLRRFAELCRKHGMLLYPRIGPWAHAEARNGGLPDWVMAGGPIRQLDPKFMAETRTLYDQVGAQLRGLLWKDGGPVIGIQLENEYAMKGPGRGAEYILALKKMAVASGFDVPLYTLTGWDNAVLPPHEFLPVYGGYPDAPWGSSRTELPPQEVYAFRFGSRVSGNMGMIGAAGGGAAEMSSATPGLAPRTPFFTAEMGGGMQDTYHRRLIMTADDIAAMMPVMLGSGVNLYGTYMFAGGQNPDGKRTTLEESQATHYPTDVPVKSYDFQAPVGEYGLERDSLRVLKEWNYFLSDFGSLLAPMAVFHPEQVPASPDDLSKLRWSVRSDGKAGFLFVNNYVRGAAMPARPHAQFEVALPGGRAVRLPSTPVDLPSGAYFAWPFGVDLGGVPLRYATAQLLTRLDGQDARANASFVFACVHGVRCELALEGEDLKVEAPAGTVVKHEGGVTLLSRSEDASTGSEPIAPILVRSSAGLELRLLVLSPAEALRTWKVPYAGAARLLTTAADVFADEQTITLRQLEDPKVTFGLYPAPTAPPGSDTPLQAKGGDVFAADLPAWKGSASLTPVRAAATPPPVGLGPPLPWRQTGVAQAPADAVWSTSAAQWAVRLQASKGEMAGFTQGNHAAGVRDLFLRIPYTGDEARLTSRGKLLDDDFFNGQDWLVGLRRYVQGDRLPALTLEVLPMRSDSPVYLPPAGRAKLAASGKAATPGEVTIVPQYQVQLRGAATP